MIFLGGVWEKMISWCFNLAADENVQHKISAFRIFEELSPFLAEVGIVKENIENLLNAFVTGFNHSDIDVFCYQHFLF